jgi:LPXTG-site transpeptidase (sortase) family protein
MDIHSLTKITNSINRHYARVMAFIVVLVSLIIFVAYQFPSILTVNVPEVTQTEQVATSTFARSAPTRLHIPKINLDTTFVPPLGLNADKTVSVPDSFEEVGWYKNGPTPGEIGPAVILGHVDSYEGAAVFYHLGQLEKGDEVYVDRADGTTATFVVTGMERKPQENFPTERVYGPINFAGLRLVTCTGVYDHGSLKYSHNLIVYAELKKEE